MDWKYGYRMKYKGFLLDFDNTILDSKGAYQFALKQIQDYWKSLYNEDNFLEKFEESKLNVKKKLNHLPYHRSRLLVFKEMLEKKDRTLNPELLLKLDGLYFQFFRDYLNKWKSENKSLFEELFEMIRLLTNSGRVVFVTNESLRTQLIKAEVVLPLGFPVSMVTSEEVGVEKPDPNYFSFILEKFSLIREQTLMVGDSREDDLAGAINSGIDGYLIDTIFTGMGMKRELYGNNSYYHFESTFHALRYILDNLK